jgi:hypothetical protein
VDLIGIEPMTSSMPWKRAPSCATGPLTVATQVYTNRRAENRILLLSAGWLPAMAFESDEDYTQSGRPSNGAADRSIRA